MKRTMPSRVRRADRGEAIAASLAEHPDRKFEPDKPQRIPAQSQGFLRGLPIVQWEAIELNIERKRCLRHVQACHKKHCLFCEYALRKIQPIFEAA